MTAPTFLTLMDLSADEIRRLIRRAIELKALRGRASPQHYRAGFGDGLYQASTRTASPLAGMSNSG